MDNGRRTLMKHAVLASSALAFSKAGTAQSVASPAGCQRIAVEGTERHVLGSAPALLYLRPGRRADQFAIDAPFAPSEAAARWMEAAPVSEADKGKIYQENAERVFSL
jgi:hypothetical protein